MGIFFLPVLFKLLGYGVAIGLIMLHTQLLFRTNPTAESETIQGRPTRL